MTERKIKLILTAKHTMDGAGVGLYRAFGYSELPLFDPFLMLDDFSSDNPDNFKEGFPWHPHRGIETITYLLKGSAEHEDSMGNKGTITAGGVQWMTAGSGIIHQEMPKPDNDGKVYGFQIWSNLPKSEKMMNPRYQNLDNEDVPSVSLDDGSIIKIICGSYKGKTGPVKDIITDPQFLDVSLGVNTEFTIKTTEGYTCFLYVYEGVGVIQFKTISHRQVVLFEDGEDIRITTGNQPFNFLFLSGKPLHEQIAWRGSMVMNTEEEISDAYKEFRDGTFIKK